MVYEDVLKSTIGLLGKPIIYDVDFGHVMPQWTMINGAYATFTYENGKGKIVQELV